MQNAVVLSYWQLSIVVSAMIFCGFALSGFFANGAIYDLRTRIEHLRRAIMDIKHSDSKDYQHWYMDTKRKAAMALRIDDTAEFGATKQPKSQKEKEGNA